MNDLDKSKEVKRMMEQLPPHIKEKMPQSLRDEIRDNPTIMTMVKMVNWLSTIESKPTDEDYVGADQDIKNIVAFVDTVNAYLYKISDMDDERVSAMMLSLYGACQRFCVEYNKVMK